MPSRTGSSKSVDLLSWAAFLLAAFIFLGSSAHAANTPPTATNRNQDISYPPNTTDVALNDIVVTDPDPGEQITAKLTNNNPNLGALSAASGNGETYTTASGVWTITDTVAKVNSALAAVTFQPIAGNVQDVSLGVQIQDGLEDGSITLLGTIRLNAAPIVNSASASPNPVVVAADATFAASATDGPGSDLTYAWDFGDGNTGTGASTTHAFALIGTYTVTVSVNDGKGGVSTASFSVEVVPAVPVAGVGDDSDADGFSDNLETFVGSNPLAFASTPFNIPALGTPEYGLIKRLHINLNFKPGRTGEDRILLIGELPIPAGFNFSGERIVVDIAGVQLDMTLDEKGKGEDGTVQIRVSTVSKGFSLFRLGRGFIGDYQTTLSMYADLSNQEVYGKPRTVKVTMLFNGQAHVRNMSVRYRGFLDRKGVATKTGKETPINP